jgi:GGDEF domain-containing protein
VYPHDAADAESLLRIADSAMFEAKRVRQEAREDRHTRARV